MSKYLTVSLLTLAFLLGFLFQVRAFEVERYNPVDSSTAYPQIKEDVGADAAFDTNNSAAVYNEKLEQYIVNSINTTSVSGFWQ